MSPPIPLTPPHTPAASLTPSSSIRTVPSTDNDTDLDIDPSRFLLLTHVPRDTHSDSIKRVFTDLIQPHTPTDPIHGVFVALQKSEGKIVIAFFDSRDAAAVVTAATEADAPFRLAALLGGSPPPGLKCRFISVSELEQLIGKTKRVTNQHGSFVLSLESTTTTQIDSESHELVKAFLVQFGDIRTFAFANDPPHVDTKTNIIHVEFYDIRDAQNASTAINGRVIGGCRVCVFGQAAESDEAQNSAKRRIEESAFIVKEIGIAFSPEGASGGSDSDGCEAAQKLATKQRPRSASAGTKATDSARHALRPISQVFNTSFPHIPTATGSIDLSDHHSRHIHGPAQMHDVLGRRCSNQLLFDAARRSAIPPPNSEPEGSRRSLSIGGRQFAEGSDLEQAVKDRDEGWIGTDDPYAGPLLAHAHSYAYAPQHQHQPQYYFPPISCMPTADVTAEGNRGAYFPPPSSYYGLSPSLPFAPPPTSTTSSQPMSFTGYEYDYDVHLANLGFHAPAVTRTGRSSGIGQGWGLDHTMAQEYWYGSMMSAAGGYYPTAHQQPHPMRHHHAHPTQQLMHPYNLRGGHPHVHFGPETFGGYTYPLQPVVPGMVGGLGHSQLSVQMPGVDITSSAPVRREIDRVPSPNDESNVGAAISAATNVAAATGIDRNHLNLARIADGQDTRTTVMIKNIPNKMSDKDLLDYIWQVCPRRIDFLYLRMDFRNECNVGYAFVNFIAVEDLLKFARARLDVKWNMFSSEKVLHMSYANYQGKEALIEKFKNSCIMDERDAWRPKIFYSEPGPNQGLREPFPPPTHFRRKERSSHNRGALFVPSLLGQDRHHGKSSGSKRRQQGTVNQGVVLGQLPHPNQNHRGQHKARDDEDGVIGERHDLGERGCFVRDGGANVSEVKGEQPSYIGGVEGLMTSRYPKSDQQRSSK